MIGSLRTLAALRVRGRAAAAGAALALAFALSLVLFLAPSPGRARRVLFFPSAGSPSRLVAELRLLPRHRDLDRDVREVVDAVLLGPARHGESPLFPSATTVRTLLVRRGVAYVDLSAAAAIPDPLAPVALEDAAAALERAVTFNFPGVRAVAFTVDGQAPRSIREGRKNI